MPATIVVVDDHPVFRQGLCHLLAKEKNLSIVGEAGDGRTAIDLVRRENPDIVVMDVSMPDIDGIEATRQILSELPDTKIVALSMHSSKQFIEGMIQAGASGYILKESVPEEMIQGIRTVLAGKFYLSASISGIVISEYKKLLSATDSAAETPTEPILRTKLQRPPLSSDIIPRPRLIEQLEKGRQGVMTLVSAPAGYGKSIAVSQWLEACEYPAAWVSLDKTDNDLRLFLNYFVTAIQTISPDAGRKILAMADALAPLSASSLADSLINELDLIGQSFILVLDDYQLIKNESVHGLLIHLLNHPPRSMHLVIIGRRDAPLPISKMRAQGLVTEIRTQDLRFTEPETEMFLNQAMEIPIDPATAIAVGKKTEGWVTGLRLAALSMRNQGVLDPRLLEPQVDANYVMEYLFKEVFADKPPEVSQYLLGTAILDRFCGPLCESVCAPGIDPFTCEYGGWHFIAWLKKENFFLIPLDPENKWFRYHHLFQKFLVNQLKRHCSTEEIKTLHAQAGVWFFENDLIEEALKHTLASGDMETAGSMVAQFSHNLLNDQQWLRLERCLNLLPRDQVQRDPALLVLEAWLYHVRQNLSGMASCSKRIETLNAASPPDTYVNLKYVQGHLEAILAFQHFMAAEGESALALCRRALRGIPRHHKRARLFADIFQLGAYQMTGNLETGLSIYHEAMERYIGRDKNYHALYLANLGLVHWMDANLIVLQQTAESLLDVIMEDPLPVTVPYGLYFLGIVHYHRNELQYAEEKLAKVLKTCYAVSPMNCAHSAFALALTYQAQGKRGLARKISKSVVVDSIETNNADMLQVARAFEAELALHQGRLAEAFKWAEEYQAKPFKQIYRFYLPQITLIRTQLVQGTTDSLHQAVDLLDRLHGFLVSIHNSRFQIDALALQALLHDSLGQNSTALEKLTAALTLAEPGGFIRLFVDLGPQMADLLKQLINQNIAVDYAGQILSAFSEDARTIVPGAIHHDPSPDHSISPSQPLIEPLTNRELEILDLLAQRLQNKEIAARLFISPQTIKKHLNNIYGKLNVRNRRQAVEKAGTLGILPPHKG